METGSRPAPHSRLLPLPSSLRSTAGVRLPSRRMNESREPSPTLPALAPCPQLRRTGQERSTGADPSPGEWLIPRRGLEAVELLLRRPHPCSSPFTLRAAATRCLTVPGPRRRLLTLPSPPASGDLQLPLGRAARAPAA